MTEENKQPEVAPEVDQQEAFRQFITDLQKRLNGTGVSEWYTRHVRVTDAFGDSVGGITLRYRLVGNRAVEYKFSICNPKDQYSRKLGVQITDAKTEISTMQLPPFELSRESVVDVIVSDIFEKNRKTLSRQAVSLIYHFVLGRQVKEIKNFFYPTKD